MQFETYNKKREGEFPSRPVSIDKQKREGDLHPAFACVLKS